MTAIRTAQCLLASFQGSLRDEVEWAWHSYSESLWKDSEVTGDEREERENRFRLASQRLGDCVGCSKELERLLWELEKEKTRRKGEQEQI